MKRKILLFVAVIMLTINVSAQYKEFQFGLMGQPGYNWLTVSSGKIFDVQNNFSYKYGLFGSFYFSENYGFLTGFYMLQQKAKYKFEYEISEFKTEYSHTFNVSYIQLPLLLKCRTDMMAKTIRISGQFGAGLDFLVNHKDTYDFIGETDNSNLAKYRNFGMSLMIGIGTEVAVFKTSSLVFHVVLDKSFTSVIKTGGYYDSPMKMTSLYFEIGFIF